MSLGLWDIGQFVIPIAAGAVGGPIAGMAASAALKGGTTAAKGGSAFDILKSGALGAASGAAGMGLSNAISGAAGQAASKVAEKGGEAATQAFANAGTEGFAKATDTAMNALASAGAKQKALMKFSDVMGNAMGDNAENTAKMLEMVQKGGKVVGAIDQVGQMMYPEQRFGQVSPDMISQYSSVIPHRKSPFSGGYSTPTLGYLGGY